MRVVLGEPAQSLHLAWDVPYGSLFLELDPLSGFFLVPVFVLCALAAIYGAGYLEAYRNRKALAPPWFFFNLLVASMVLVILARNGVLFLMAYHLHEHLGQSIAYARTVGVVPPWSQKQGM
ncbi:MAG: hypothetical protein HY275_17360 [Gemmatimonadetes bacterium]|nr:hypothetical protein [Gemmatimonadota bacterium]